MKKRSNPELILRKKLYNKLKKELKYNQSTIIEIFSKDLFDGITLNYLLLLGEYDLVDQFIFNLINFQKLHNIWFHGMMGRLNHKGKLNDKKTKKKQSKKHVKQKSS